MFHQTSVSTSESYCVQVPMATSDHDYVVPQESDLSKLELAQATWGGECIFKRGKVWTRTISQWWQYDKFLHRIETLKAVFCALKPTATTMIRWTRMRQGADLEKVKKQS